MHTGVRGEAQSTYLNSYFPSLLSRKDLTETLG